jgi:tryptophanyl-tRNA synthetase
MADRRRVSERQQEAVAEAMASLELGIPERVARASARADGAKTPAPMSVLFL